MENRKYIIEIPVEKCASNFTGSFRDNFSSRWNETTESIKNGIVKGRKISFVNKNDDYGAIKTSSGVCRFSDVKEVKYV